jgi:hypothetical protein
MLIKENGQLLLKKNNNPTIIKGFKLPIANINSQSRNCNNALTNEKKLRKYSLYSTKEATPRKEYNKVVMPPSLKNSFFKQNKEKADKNDLDDSLSQISQLLNNNKNVNYSNMVGKIPGINEEPNFVYDQMIFNKSRINKAKILSHKIGVLKLPISKISSKEALTNSDREKKCFSDRVQGNQITNKKNSSNNNMNDNNADVSCCFFGRIKHF